MAYRLNIIPQHLFRAEANKLSAVFGTELVAIHHLGSIDHSGPGTKPIVEIWVEVNNIARITNFNWLAAEEDDLLIDGFTRHLIELGYSPWGEHGLTGRRFFTKDTDPAAKYCVHVYQFGHFQPGYPRDSTHWGSLMHWLTEPNEAEVFTFEKMEDWVG